MKEDGSKSWLFIWTRDGKRQSIGLGRYKSHDGDTGLKLAEARDAAKKCRELLKAGTDPKEERERIRIAAEQAELEKSGKLTFKALATEYIETHEPTWSNPKHRQQWRNTILGSDKINYCKSIHRKRIDEITRDDILSILQPIWLTKQETATRVRGRLEKIFDLAEERELITRNPARMRGNLKNSLPKVKATVKHHPALPYKSMPEFMGQLRNTEAVSARALEFLILNAVRASECVNAPWSEIDLDTALWVIPPDRMKARQEHQIPLSDRSIDILKSMQAIRTNDFIFPGLKPLRPISHGSLDRLLERMGHADITIHGFRSSFRDWAGDETSFDREIAEFSLAHRVGDSTEQAYRRERSLDKRRALLSAWADYCQGSEKANVLEFKHG